MKAKLLKTLQIGRTRHAKGSVIDVNSITDLPKGSAVELIRKNTKKGDK